MRFIVIPSVVFWAVNIPVRLLLTSIHLVQDAAEREVMAMTYMAMMRDRAGVKLIEKEDRRFILAALIRPTSSAVIHDAAPPHVLEILSKLGGSR